MKLVHGRQIYGESARKACSYLVIFGESITNLSRYHKNIFNQKTEDCRARFKYSPGSLSGDILHNVNPTLGESEFDVAIMHEGVNNLLNCQAYIDLINNILQDIQHIVYKSRQYGVKSKFLSRLTSTNRLPEKLMKDLNISFVICAAKYQITIIKSCKHNAE